MLELFLGTVLGSVTFPVILYMIIMIEDFLELYGPISISLWINNHKQSGINIFELIVTIILNIILSLVICAIMTS